MKKKMLKWISACLILCMLVPFFASCAKAPSETVETDVKTEILEETATKQESVDTQEEEKEEPLSSATLGVIGDILIHETVYNAAKQSDGTYDFKENYEYIKPYLERFDFAVANLEVTLGGENPTVGTYPSAYPLFNCPDSIVDALKYAGVDMLLTANNHSYDTSEAGLKRTVQVVKEKGLECLGTRQEKDEKTFLVQELNGIRIGMACYTYSEFTSSGRKALNGITMSENASSLVSSFALSHLEEFYREAEKTISDMKAQGAQSIVFYMHWGNEYQYQPAKSQQQIAQRLCDMGVDVIIGGHPHVIQPFETLTGINGNETLCIYSLGNAISNQRKELMSSDGYSGHTEDGMIFSVKFQKNRDGSVSVSEVNIEPTWTIREKIQGVYEFRIIPLDLSVGDWKQFALTDATLKQAKDSYNRTMKLVSDGLNQARAKRGLDAVEVSIS